MNSAAQADAEIITLRAIALKRRLPLLRPTDVHCRDHNATSYSTETFLRILVNKLFSAEIITLRAIALKRCRAAEDRSSGIAEIITLRAIALKPMSARVLNALLGCRDHNATSYSTETMKLRCSK